MSAKLFWAHVRMHFYLLLVGMWRGQCAFEGRNKQGRVVEHRLLGAVLADLGSQAAALGSDVRTDAAVDQYLVIGLFDFLFNELGKAEHALSTSKFSPRYNP